VCVLPERRPRRELYDDEEELLAFVPYESLEALLTDAATETAGRSVMYRTRNHGDYCTCFPVRPHALVRSTPK